MSHVIDRGKHVVLTGVTGFVGKVVLEQLLREREQHGITGVSVLIRPSKDRAGNPITAQHRFAKGVADAKVFAGLESGWADLVTVISGDLEKPRCGISDEDFAAVTARATHVIHCAASVEFDLPVAQAAAANVTTALGVLELARACRQLVGMVDVSTAYVSVWRPGPIEEKLAHLPRPAEELYAGFQKDPSSGAGFLAQTGHPNTYTLTKCVAEHLISERRGDVPVVIVRPSIVSAAWKAPFPGWLDSPAALAGCLLYTGLGVVRAFNADPGVRLDVVPVDLVSQEIVNAAFGPMPAPSAPVPIVHAAMGIKDAMRIDLAAGSTVDYFRRRPGVVRPPEMFVGRVDHGFGENDMVRRELPLQAMRSFLTLTGKGRARRRLEKADERVRYLNDCFHYFTHHTFDFRRAVPLETHDFEPVEYVKVVNQGLYRHLLRRDETEMPFAGPRHDDARGDLAWLGERPGQNATIKAFGLGLRKTLRKCASNITFDRPSFERAMAAVPPDAVIVLAPSHRSYFDFLLSSYLCFQHPELGIPVPHIAAAEEFGKIPVVGKILRESQAFFIKRGVGKEVPELNDELSRLCAKNASLMFFVEGQRSRSRLFLAPKRGLLRGLQATGRTFAVLPIAMSYDRLPEEGALERELTGGKKPKMSLVAVLRWMAQMAQDKVKLGRMHMACGAPLVMSAGTDVKALADHLVAEQQRLTTVSSFHLRAFLAESGLGGKGIDEKFLAAAIRARGGRVLHSDLAVPQPFSSTLAQSLRNQWMHWFYGDALARYPENLAVRDHIERNAWMSILERDDRDGKIDAVVDALMAPIVRDYRTAATRIGTPLGKRVELGPSDLARANPSLHLPHLEDAFQALAARDIVRAGEQGQYAWGDNAHMVEEFRAALARGQEVVS